MDNSEYEAKGSGKSLTKHTVFVVRITKYIYTFVQSYGNTEAKFAPGHTCNTNKLVYMCLPTEKLKHL